MGEGTFDDPKQNSLAFGVIGGILVRLDGDDGRGHLGRREKIAGGNVKELVHFGIVGDNGGDGTVIRISGFGTKPLCPLFFYHHRDVGEGDLGFQQ